MTNDDKPPLWLLFLVMALTLIILLLASLTAKKPEMKLLPNIGLSECFLEDPRVPVRPSYTILACVSGYSKVETCPNRDCKTASGKMASKDIIACPYNIPLGTVVEIEGIGKFICGDRTARWIQEKYGDTFDLWFENYIEAKKFGRQYKEVVIYK